MQRFSQFDEVGTSLAAEWQTIIDDATKRLGGKADSRCRVTVTDKFGGRGHDFQVCRSPASPRISPDLPRDLFSPSDFQVVDKESNANGGMLVITTSVPDEREWVQWKGRTSRQDRPGHLYVLLDTSGAPFNEPKHKRLLGKLRATPEPEARVSLLLEAADDGLRERLQKYSGEQAGGTLLNELIEKYYRRHPRDFDCDWPSPKYPSDTVLRR